MIYFFVVDKYSALRETDDDLLNDIFGPEQTSVESNMSDLSLSSDSAGAGGSNTTLTSGFLPADLLDSSDLSGLQLQGKSNQYRQGIPLILMVGNKPLCLVKECVRKMITVDFRHSTSCYLLLLALSELKVSGRSSDQNTSSIN